MNCLPGLNACRASAAVLTLAGWLGPANSAVLGADSPKTLNGKTTASHQTNFIEGWRVLVNERLLSQEKEATEKALEMLRLQLREIVRVVPAPALANCAR